MRIPHKARLPLIGLATLGLAAVGNHIVAASVGLTPSGATYRRIGPKTGRQVFVAGSSVLQFGLSWPDVSVRLDQGLENWGVGGSSPEIWEVSQRLATNSDLMIIGVSFYDLNEYHLSNSRPNIVPLDQTIRDLRLSGTDWLLSHRVLSQYPLAYVRAVFPTAGQSEAVLVGLRRIARQHLTLSSAQEDRANALVLPRGPVLDFGESTERLSDWDPGKTLRRLAGLRSEIRGLHSFRGPKQLAFGRMLQQAQQRGRVIIVVLPVARAYQREFLTSAVIQEFEYALGQAHCSGPTASIIRLDRVSELGSDDHFSDFVHLNSAGREIATRAFLKELNTLSIGSPTK